MVKSHLSRMERRLRYLIHLKWLKFKSKRIAKWLGLWLLKSKLSRVKREWFRSLRRRRWRRRVRFLKRKSLYSSRKRRRRWRLMSSMRKASFQIANGRTSKGRSMLRSTRYFKRCRERNTRRRMGWSVSPRKVRKKPWSGMRPQLGSSKKLNTLIKFLSKSFPMTELPWKRVLKTTARR